MDTTFIARQPVFRRNLEVYGYELLFRSGEENNSDLQDGNLATANVVLQALADFGLNHAVDDKRAFVNVTRNLLIDGDLTCLPPGRSVLEVRGDIEPEELVLDGIRKLSAEGYTIALDDDVHRADLAPLMQLADIVKINLPQISPDDLPRHIARLRDDGIHVLVENLETHEDFELCKKLGCDYFQGYFFCQPHLVSHPQLQSNRVAVVQLVAALHDPEISPKKIEALLETDAGLCYRILRYANSAKSSTVEEVDTIRHAAALIGLSRIKSFATMLLMAGITDDKPRELFNVSMTRAKTCENLARRLKVNRPDRLFTVGMISAFDALLDMPMPEVLELLPIASDMNEALLHRTGKIGDILACVLEHEIGNMPAGPDAESVIEPPRPLPIINPAHPPVS